MGLVAADHAGVTGTGEGEGAAAGIRGYRLRVADAREGVDLAPSEFLTYPPRPRHSSSLLLAFFTSTRNHERNYSHHLLLFLHRAFKQQANSCMEIWLGLDAFTTSLPSTMCTGPMEMPSKPTPGTKQIHYQIIGFQIFFLDIEGFVRLENLISAKTCIIRARNLEFWTCTFTQEKDV